MESGGGVGGGARVRLAVWLLRALGCTEVSDDGLLKVIFGHERDLP